MRRHENLQNSFRLETDNNINDSEDIITDKELTFENHILTICQKAGFQTNVLGRIHKFIGLQEMEILT